MTDPTLLPVVLGLLWIVLANVAGMLPSRGGHWRRAGLLIAVGLPLLAWIFWQSGALWGAAFLLAGASILRVPLRSLAVWLMRAAGR